MESLARITDTSALLSLTPPAISLLFASTAAILVVLWSLWSLWSLRSNARPPVPLASARNEEKKSVSLFSSKRCWTDKSHFQLERRALFSKTWVCIGHRSQFAKPGDYLAQDFGGFPILLITGKDGIVRAFHNVCRHRAFPVAHKESGSASILGCQYHGWSYNSLGHLTKAPHFDQVPGFNKAENGLFPIQTKTDRQGFLHINLNVQESSSTRDICIRASSHINTNARLIHRFDLNGQFNWKVTALDRQGNERSESQAAQAGYASARVSQILTAMGLRSARRPSPFSFTTVIAMDSRPLWYQVTYSPKSPSETTIRCSVYATSEHGASNFDENTKHRLESDVKLMVKKYEDAYGQLIQSPLDSNTEDLANHASHSAELVRLVQAHYDEEARAGREIQPWAGQQCRGASFAKAESLCQAVMCSDKSLEW